MDVLVVEDSEIIARRLTEMLAEIPTVDGSLRAGSADEAMRLAGDHRPGIVLLDIRIPGRNGCEIISDIKRVSPESTIIMLTNNADPRYRAHCISCGASYFFDKSGDIEPVVALI